MASTDDQDTGRRASGRRRPNPVVYRRRRLAVTILALLVVAVVAVGAVALGVVLGRGSNANADGLPTSSASAAAPSPAAERSPRPTPTSPTPTSPAPTSAPPSTSDATAQPSPSDDGCEAGVVVAAETDKPAYEPDEAPVLSLVVRNTGREDCTVNVGTSQMEFVLTRDDERVFSSIDCQQASQDLQRTITPGGEERATFEWSRTRSVPGCALVDAEPAPGTYRLTTRLGARSSSPVEFTLR